MGSTGEIGIYWVSIVKEEFFFKYHNSVMEQCFEMPIAFLELRPAEVSQKRGHYHAWLSCGLKRKNFYYGGSSSTKLVFFLKSVQNKLIT